MGGSVGVEGGVAVCVEGGAAVCVEGVVAGAGGAGCCAASANEDVASAMQLSFRVNFIHYSRGVKKPGWKGVL